MTRLELEGGARLRSLTEADAPAMFALLEADRAHFDRWLRWSPTLRSLDDVTRFIALFAAQEAEGNGFHLGLFDGDALVGGVVCWSIHPSRRTSEVGYWLGTRQLGRGLATRASSAVVEHLFAACDVHRIEMLVALENARSRAIPERLGFRLEGVRRGSLRIGGVFRDHVVYARLAGDPPPDPAGAPSRQLTAEEFDALLARLADGWTRRDYAAVAAEFAADVRYGDPTRYALAGKSALQAFFEDDDGQPQRVTWHHAVFDQGRQLGAAEYTYEGTHRYHGMVLVRLDGGVITHWREHQHVDPRAWDEFIGGTRFPVSGGTLLLTACALLAFAGNSLLCRAAIGGGAIDPSNFTVLRLASGALALLLMSGGRLPELPRGRANFLTALPLALYAIAFAFAYVRLSAGTGALILFGAVQLTMLTSAWRAGERPGFVEWLGIALALAGLAWLVAPGVTAPPPGSAALMAVAGVAWGVYSLHGRGSGNALAETTMNFTRAIPFALLTQIGAGSRPHWTWPGIGLAIASGALASGVGYALWYRALPRLTATRAAAVQLAVPALAALGGVLFLGERLSTRLVLAAALILGGIGLTLARRRGSGAPLTGPEATR